MAGRFQFDGMRRHVARKAHHCEFCHGQIAPGTPYLRFVGKWQGDFQNWAIHEPCEKVRDMVWDGDDGALPDAGDLSAREYLAMFDRANVPADGLWFGGPLEARIRMGTDEDGMDARDALGLDDEEDVA